MTNEQQTTGNDVPEEIRANLDIFNTPEWSGEMIGLLTRFINSNNYDFIGLRAFRDNFLLQSGCDWITTNKKTGDKLNIFAQRFMAKKAMVHIIEDGVFLPYKIPNPFNPTFRTTAIRLNTHHRATKAYYANYKKLLANTNIEHEGK